MSKVKAVLDFAEAYDATNPNKQAEHAALEAEVNLLSEQDEWEEHAIHGAVIAAIYADHVTAELQAENAALRAKVAELEAGREWLPIDKAPKDGVTRILVLIADGSDESIQTVAVRDTSNGCWVSSWTGEVLYPPSHFMYLPQGIAK